MALDLSQPEKDLYNDIAKSIGNKLVSLPVETYWRDNLSLLDKTMTGFLKYSFLVVSAINNNKEHITPMPVILGMLSYYLNKATYLIAGEQNVIAKDKEVLLEKLSTEYVNFDNTSTLVDIVSLQNILALIDEEDATRDLSKFKYYYGKIFIAFVQRRAILVPVI